MGKNKESNTASKGSPTSGKSTKNSQSSATNPFVKIFNVIVFVLRGLLFTCLSFFLLNWVFGQYEKRFVPMVGELQVIDQKHSLNYYCQGSKESPFLVWVVPGADCGFLLHSSMIEDLSSSIRICSYDRPGRGFSTGRVNTTNVEDAVEDLHQLISQQRTNTQKLVLVGHTFGGLVASAYALQKGNVDALILLEPFPTTLFLNSEGESLLNYLRGAATKIQVASIIGLMRLGSIIKPDLLLYNTIPQALHLAHTKYLNQISNFDLKEFDHGITFANFLKKRAEPNTPMLSVPTRIVRVKQFFSEKWNQTLETLWTQDAVWTLLSSKQETVTEDMDNSPINSPSLTAKHTLEFIKKIFQ